MVMAGAAAGASIRSAMTMTTSIRSAMRQAAAAHARHHGARAARCRRKTRNANISIKHYNNDVGNDMMPMW